MPPGLSEEEREKRAALGAMRWELLAGRGVLLIVPQGEGRGSMIGAVSEAAGRALGMRPGMVLSILPVHHEGEVEDDVRER